MTEIWDIYNKDRKIIGKIKRGEKLKDNQYHLVVNVWIKNSKNEFLITQRSESKTFPLKWETTGGSALTKETSLEAALREAKEELGIKLNPKNAILIGTTYRYYPNCNDILDVYLFKEDIKLQNIKVQKEEVNDVMWASKEKILDLYRQDKFEANDFFSKILE